MLNDALFCQLIRKKCQRFFLFSSCIQLYKFTWIVALLKVQMQHNIAQEQQQKQHFGPKNIYCIPQCIFGFNVLLQEKVNKCHQANLSHSFLLWLYYILCLFAL